MKLYFDGTLIGSNSSSTAQVTDNGSPVSIGCQIVWNQGYTSGNMELLRVYDRVLADSEIQSLYQEVQVPAPSCNDGVKNQDEISIDQGGIC